MNYFLELSGESSKLLLLAISMNPRYLLCDEPNSEARSQDSILIDNLIKEITEEYNITTIVNTRHEFCNKLVRTSHLYILDQSGGKKQRRTNQLK